MNRLSFSGHESFPCRQFWLKKGFDFVDTKNKFTSDAAVVNLGVGKNMVASIRFWLKAFDLIDNQDSIKGVAEYLFGKDGQDAYLEDLGSIWLLHYLLIQSRRASIYNLVFNEFRKERIEFNKAQLHDFLRKKCDLVTSTTYNKNTINTDINVFLRSYLKPLKEDKAGIEESFSYVLIDLDIINRVNKDSGLENKREEWYKIESNERPELPYQIVLFTILDNSEYGQSVSFKELQIGENSPGLVFALNAEGLYQKIKQVEEHYSDITFSETAGNQVLQFKSKPDKWNILNDYYGE